MTAMQKDIGSRILTVGCINPIVLNSSVGSEDNTEQNGFAVDRELLNPGQPLALSGQAALVYSYSLAAAKTVALTWNLQHSSAASVWADFNDINGSTGQSKTIGTTSSTASQTGNGTSRANFDFSGAKRYLRMQYKMNFSATATDDADVGGVIVFGGYDTVPASTAGV
jgi:hypothetical protein